MNDIRKKSTGKNILDIPIFRSVWGKAIAGAAALVMFCTVYALILPAAAITGTEAKEEAGFHLENEENSSEQENVSVEDIQSDTTDITEAARIAESEASQSEPEDADQTGAGVTAQIAGAEPTDPEATEIILPEAEKNPEQSSTETTDSEINENENKDTEKTVKGGAEETAESAEEEKLQPGEASVDPVDSETSEEEPTEASEDEEIKEDDPEEGIAEEEEISEETEEAEVFEDGQLIFEGEDYKVTLDYSADARIPSNSHLDVREILDGDDYDGYLKTAADAVNKKTSEVRARLFDITILSEDEDGKTKEIQPREAVKVSITYDEAMQIPADAEMQTVHIPDEGEGETLETEVETAGNTETEIESVAFETDGFSVFVVMYTVDLYIEADGETYKISVTYDENAGIPDEAELRVSEITKQDEKYEEYYAAAIEAAGGVYVPQETEGESIDGYARFFDIEIWANEQKIEPKADVSVSISLKDADADMLKELQVVHFETDAGEPALLDAHVGTDEALEFETESFSVYAVITAPDPNGVNDLAGRSFTMDIGGRYATANIISDAVNKLGKTTDRGQAAEWKFEATEEAGKYRIYTTLNGEKQYLTLTRRDDNNAHAGLSTETGSVFTVTDSGGGTYVFSAVSNNTTYYLNEFGGWSGNGFAGWHERSVQNDRITVSYTQPVLSEYAVIIHYNDQYYAVLNNGTLSPVIDYSPDTGEITSVHLDETTMMWTYGSVASILEDGSSGYVLRHRSGAHAYDGVGLPLGFIYTYIDPNNSDALTTTKDDYHPYDRQNYANVTRNAAIVYDSSNHRLTGSNGSNYIGVVENSDGTLQITGRNDAAGAAEVYLAKAVDANPSTIRNNAVNHIDISVDGTASITVPLAYGTYRLAIVNDEGEIIGYRAQDLVVEKGNEVDATSEVIVPITTQDIKTGEFSAFTLYKGSKEPLHDAFYMTGYTENAVGSNETAQVRIEGSFKVSDVDPVPLGEDLNSQRICDERLEKKIYYTLSVTKDVDFTLTYVDEDDPAKPTYVVIKDNAPFTVNVPTTLTNTFSYWDPENECPGIDVAEGGRGAWSRGEIHENTNWYSGADARPGMDFRLDAPNGDTKHEIVAIEVMKYVQGDYGTEIRTLSLNESTECLVNIYQNYEKLHDKTVSIGTDGIGMIYDYDVTAGTYNNPRDASIAEVADSVDDVIYDSEGNKWIYDRTLMETEYAWRYEGCPSRQEANEYNKGTAIKGEFPSKADVIGEYKYEGAELYNRFLEFYIYNIYKQAGYLQIHKSVKYNGHDPEGDSQKAALAGTYEYTVYTDNACTKPYMVDIDEPDPETGVTRKPMTLEVVIGADGAAKDSETVELPVGTYWIKETKPENGTLPVDEDGNVFDGIIEVEVTEDTSEDDPAEADFINDFTDTELTVSKEWKKEDGSDDTSKTGDITVTLIQTAYNYSVNEGEIIIGEKIENSETAYRGKYKLKVGSSSIVEKQNDPEITFPSTQTASISNLPKFDFTDEQKVIYIYSVREIQMEGYTGIETQNEEGNWVITNRPAPPTDKDTELTVTKLWKTLSGADATLDGTENIQFAIHQRKVRTEYYPVTITLYDAGSANPRHQKTIFVKKGSTFSYTMRENLADYASEHTMRQIINGTQENITGNVITENIVIDGPTRIDEAIQSDWDIEWIIVVPIFRRYTGSWATDPWNRNNTGTHIWTFDYSATPPANYKETIDDLVSAYEDITSGGAVSYQDFQYNMVINNAAPVTDAVGEVQTANFAAHFTKLPLFRKVDDDYCTYYYTIDEVKVNGKDVETDSTSGQQYTDEYYVSVDSENGTIINTERPGALKITKVLTINGRPTTISKASGKYTFKIVESDGTTPAKRKVGDNLVEVEDQIIEIDNGVITKVNGASVDADHRFALVDGLAPGDYIIKEDDPHDGSSLAEISGGVDGTADLEHRQVKVTVKAGDDTAESATAFVTFTNDKGAAMDIHILKVASSDGQLLTGAEFILRRFDEDYREEKQKWPYDPEDPDSAAPVDNEGKLAFGGLGPGYYELVETKSPDGFIKTSKDPRFQIIVDAQTGLLRVVFADASYDMVTYNAETYTFTVQNEPGAALPSTGGPGTKLFSILGGMLILIAGAFLFQRRRLI